MLIAVLAVIAVAAAGVFEVSGVLRHDAALADILANFTRYSIVWPLVVAVLAYEFASTPRLVGMEESVTACPETRHQHWLAMMVPPALLVATIFAVYLTFKLVVIFVARQWTLLLPHIFAEAVLNILVPCTIGMLLGVLTARHLSRYAGYAVIALFAFLIGPYSEVVPFLAQMNVTKGGNGIDLYPVYDLFKLLAPDPSWGMDSLYGFPLEQERWMIGGFWILGLVAVLLPTIGNPRARGIRYARITLASFAVLCLVAAFLPSSELRRDTRFFNAASTVADQAYYEMQIGRHPQREIPADFEVTRYEMELAARRQLSARVSMDIAEDEHVAAYRFTLYHGYRISRVFGSEGEKLDFAQDGDYVTVTSSTKQKRVTFDYSGSGNICIANYQGVFLPGYFPYYPVPGFVRVYDYVRQTALTSVTDRNPTEFSIAFDVRTPLVSNLEEHDGRFEGRSVAPSFVGGLLAQDKIGEYRAVFYPAGAGNPEQLVDMIARLREFERRLGVSESPVREGMTVFQMPGLTQAAGSVVLPDAFFVAGFDESLAADILVAGTPARIDRENLREAFARFIDDPSGTMDMNGKGPTSGDIAILEKARLAAPNDLDRARKYVFPAKGAVYRLFYEKVRAEGDDEALRDTYRYLSSDSPMSELEFLTQVSDGNAR